MSQTEAAPRAYPTFVRISQSILNWGNPKTIAEAVELAANLNKEAQLTYGYTETPLTATWGSAVYSITEDGSLKLVRSNFDTSD